MFFFILLATAIFFAQSSYDYGKLFSSDSKTMIATYTGLALIASAGIVSLAWMLASFLNHDGIKAYAKAELFEIVYSAVLLVLIFGFFTLFDGIVASFAPSLYDPSVVSDVNRLALKDPAYTSIPVHFQYSKFFLEKLFNQAVIFNANIYTWYSMTGTLEDIYLSLDLFWEQRGLINYNPLKGFFHMGNLMKMQVFDLVTKVSIITKFQEIFIHVFLTGVFPAFLGAGLVLRSFQMTRKVGGLMMAIALGIYFIFPLSYLLGGMVYEGTGTLYTDIITNIDSRLSPMGDVPADVEGFNADPNTLDDDIENFINDDTKTLDDKQKETEGQIEAIPPDFCKFLNFDQNPGAENDDVDKFQNSLEVWYNTLKNNEIGISAIDDTYLRITGRLIFYSMFFSFMGLMATIAGIRSLSMLFGGDLEIAGLTHLI